MREAIVFGIHPSKWVVIDRAYLREIAGFAFDDDRYAALMNALYEFRLTQTLPPTPPTEIVLKRLEKLEDNLEAAASLLQVSPKEVGGSEVGSRKFRRSAVNVNLYIWQLLEAAGATCPESITREHISRAKSNARLLATGHRPKGVTTSGRQVIPGLVQFVVSLIKIMQSSGMRAGVSYWDIGKGSNDEGSYKGFLHNFLTRILLINDLVTHLEGINGAKPPPQPVKVSNAELFWLRRWKDSVEKARIVRHNPKSLEKEKERYEIPQDTPDGDAENLLALVYFDPRREEGQDQPMELLKPSVKCVWDWCPPLSEETILSDQAIRNYFRKAKQIL